MLFCPLLLSKFMDIKTLMWLLTRFWFREMILFSPAMLSFNIHIQLYILIRWLMVMSFQSWLFVVDFFNQTLLLMLSDWAKGWVCTLCFWPCTVTCHLRVCIVCVSVHRFTRVCHEQMPQPSDRSMCSSSMAVVLVRTSCATLHCQHLKVRQAGLICCPDTLLTPRKGTQLHNQLLMFLKISRAAQGSEVGGIDR